jgi:hypothetical protein
MTDDFTDIANQCRNDGTIAVHFAGQVSNGKKLRIEADEIPQWLWMWMHTNGGYPVEAYSTRPITLTFKIPEL